MGAARPLEWAHATLIDGDVATAVPLLNAQEGPELQVHGSRQLIHPIPCRTGCWP